MSKSAVNPNSKSEQDNPGSTQFDIQLRLLNEIISFAFPFSFPLSRKFVLPFLSLYISMIIAVLGLLFVQNDFLKDGLHVETTRDKLEHVKEQLALTNNEIYLLKQNISRDASGSGSVAVLVNRVDKLEEQGKAIGDTILIDPDKAITASLLREKQKTMSDDMKSLREDQKDLRNLVTSLLIAVIASPLIFTAISYAAKFISDRGQKPLPKIN
jgi:hypothetical protein